MTSLIIMVIGPFVQKILMQIGVLIYLKKEKVLLILLMEQKYMFMQTENQVLAMQLSNLIIKLQLMPIFIKKAKTLKLFFHQITFHLVSIQLK